MSCSGLIDEARVSVDITLMERAAQTAPLLAIALVISIIGLGLSLRAAPTGHRAWFLFALCSPFGVLLAEQYLRSSYTGISFPCLVAPTLTATRHVNIAAGLATFCALQLAVIAGLRAWKGEVQLLWPGVLLSSALALSLGVGLHKASLVREFGHRVRVTKAIPNVRPPAEPPDAHLGQGVAFKPFVQSAGETVGFIFKDRVALPDADRLAWGVDTVTLTPLHEGLNTVPLVLERDLLTVEAELVVNGVRDTGVSWLPLAIGHRWEFAAARGRGGTIDRLMAGWESGRKPLPAAELVLEVTGEGVRDGFHFFELTQTGKDLEKSVIELVQRDGVVFSGTRRLAWTDEGGCVLKLVEPSRCECLVNHLVACRVLNGDVGETFLRLFLGAVTLGMTELKGMGDLGRGDEAGMILIRWRVHGEPLALGPAPKVKSSSARPASK